MKAHIGAHSKKGHMHSLCSKAAGVTDKHILPGLLHGGELKV